MADELHPAYPEFFGGAIPAPPIPRSSGLYAGIDDPFATLSALQANQRNDLRDYVTQAGDRTGQSLAIPVRNQGHYGACTGFTGTRAITWSSARRRRWETRRRPATPT
jgi:hypothetical protein